jgi:6-phosphogluconolactonase
VSTRAPESVAAARREVYADIDALSYAAADYIANAARAAVTSRGRFTIALSGGSTPRPLYRLLAGEYRDRVPWERVAVFYSDERCVPPTDPASNYGMTRDELLARVPIPPAHVHRMRGELPPGDGARDYEATLRRELPDDGPHTPLLDFALLGVGADGHTASLFPGAAAALSERARWVLHTQAPAGAPSRDRLTLTFAVLDRSRESFVLCAGPEKRDVARRIASGDRTLPAAHITALSRTVWLLDREAAGTKDA